MKEDYEMQMAGGGGLMEEVDTGQGGKNLDVF